MSLSIDVVESTPIICPACGGLWRSYYMNKNTGKYCFISTSQVENPNIDVNVYNYAQCTHLISGLMCGAIIEYRINE